MQIGEQHLARTQHAAFRDLRLFDLDDHVRAREHVFGAPGDFRAGRLIVRVLEADAGASTGLHQHLMPRVDQLAHAGGHEPDPVLVDLDLFRNADFHG